MRKRAAAILLALCMALTLLPTAAFATEEGGAAAPVEQPTQQEEKQEGQQEQPEETPEQPEEQPEAKPAEQPEQQQEPAAQGGPAVQSNETGIALLADEHKHCICGGSVTAGDHTSHSDVAYQPWNGTDGISYTNNTAYVYLTGNATISSHLTVDGKTLYLCLNGKTLSSNGTAKIQVENGGRLVLCDCRGGGTFEGATKNVWGGACVYLYKSTLDMFGGKLTGGKVTGKGGGGAIALDDQQCIFNMYGGEISGNNGNNYGGAIFRQFNANMPNTTGGAFNMYGGVIKNNTAKNGGAYFSTTGGTINMTGGTISGNTATQSNNDAGGGAIYMRGSGTINISGNAKITGNSSSLDGGAILMGWGEINISGSAKINNNTANRWGGAICLRQDSNQSTTLNMRGGEISGNKATKEGGAVHVLDKQCQFFLYDGKITGNTSGDGGAIYLNQEPSWLIMQGGEISGNTATGNGGGVYIYRSGSVCQLYSGKIENNKASGNGGGIYINPSNSGQLKVGNKPIVQNNTVSGKANNVYLPSGKTLTIEIGMSKGASIGVTTANTSYPVAFSNAYAKDYAKCFFADDANAHVEYKDDQKLYLVSGAVARPLTVTFDPNGGTLAEADRTRSLMTGETYGALPVPSYEGYDFAGWYTEQNGGTKIESDTTVTVAGTQTLYAHWTEHEYTVTVVKIGMPEWGSVTPMSTKAKAGETVTLTATPTTGNQFLEWVFLNKPEGGGWVNPVLTFTMPAEDLTIQAKFTVKNYSIGYTTVGVGGGSAWYVRWGDRVFDYLPKNPTYQDWVFTGWKCGDVTVTEDMTYGDLAGSDTVSGIHIDAQWHQHKFNMWMNNTPGTLKSPADCTHNALHYWMCSCDLIEYNDDHLYEEPGTALGHLWSWTSNGNGTHTRTCQRENCNATETDTCSGGTATCTAKAKCSTCNAEYGEKLPHDFTAETAEEQYLKSGSSCTEKAVYYKSCTVCGLSSKGTDGEATFESGSVLGHDWGAWTQNSDGSSHTRICKRDANHRENGTCSGGAATCTAKAKCSTCNAEYGGKNPNNHAGTLGGWQSDENKHWKEYSCCRVNDEEGPHDWDNGKVTTQPTCTNAGEKTFTCNECGRKKTEQIDATGHSWKQEWNSDETHHWHECANGCDAKDAYAEHADADKNHVCDTCGKVLSECADDNKDHKCDYCGKVLSECADDNKDHKCDYCGKVLSECADTDKDHKCDYCGKTLSECADDNKDHKCDYCGKTLSECTDDNKDHKCDYCGKVLSECADDNKDHKCDYCGKTLSECADDNKDHKCDYCGKTISNHTGGTADCCHKAVCEICGKAYGGLDPDNHTDLKHFPAQRATILREGNIEYWYCSGCGKYYKDAEATIEITQEDTVIPKVKRDNSGIPSHGGETGKTDKNDKTVQSVKTGDAGVALYGAMALLSLTGGAWIVGKKRRS